jgi:hypothetical protein
MANFPTLTIPPSYPLVEELEDATLRSPFEDGSVQSRPKYTKTRYTFTINYDLLPKADRNTLMTFVKTTVREGADSFIWTHPGLGTTHTVTFVELPKPSYTINGYYQLNFKVREC